MQEVVDQWISDGQDVSAALRRAAESGITLVRMVDDCPQVARYAGRARELGLDR